jgi:hypothetical protein
LRRPAANEAALDAKDTLEGEDGLASNSALDGGLELASVEEVDEMAAADSTQPIEAWFLFSLPVLNPS